jgi:hypothetical protein
MIKLTLDELFRARQVFGKLSRMDFSLRTGYAITRLTRAIDAELAPALAKVQDLRKKYGEQDANDGNVWNVTPANKAAFDRETHELGSLEVEVACSPIKIAMLDSEHLPTHERLLAILTEVREQKRAPLDAIPEIRGLTVRLSPTEILWIEKFLEPESE